MEIIIFVLETNLHELKSNYYTICLLLPDRLGLVPGRGLLHLSLPPHRLRLHAHRTVSDACALLARKFGQRLRD